MSVAACPDADTLAAFARGALTVAELDGVAAHVDRCGACAAALRAVPDDSLAGLARSAVASPNTVAADPVATAARAGGVPAGFADHPRYRILGELGAGGMGTVYKAEDRWMGRVIAIKVVSPHLTAKAAALDRFRKEVRAAAQLNDPRVVIAHDTGEAGGCQFLVMEHVDGVSLDRLVAKKGPLSVPMACAFTRHAALGLQHAADRGMVHRDIKPQNLMVTRKGQVKILDFGLARLADAGDAGEGATVFGGRPPEGAPAAGGVTSPNVVMGTPDYLSPEQARSSHNVDHRSDIYSLGCTLYFLLTGRPPFHAATTLVDKLLAHTHDAPASPQDDRPEVPDGLDSILARMMAKRPDDRYQTAAEVAAALLPFARADAAKDVVFEVVEAALVTPGPRPTLATVPTYDTAPVAGATVADAPRPRRKRRKASWWRRRQRAVFAGAVAAAVLVAAVVVAGAVRKKPTAAPAEGPPAETVKVATPAAAPKADAPKPDAKPEKGKGEPNAPTVIVPPPAKPTRVLFVLPSTGLWLHEFQPVREHLTRRGMPVVTASHAGGTARPAALTSGAPVAVDVLLRPDMDLSDYAAVLFCGERIDEYVPSGVGGPAASRAIKQMQSAGRPVGGIGLGIGVLATNGVLRDKRSAHSRPLFDKHPLTPWDKMGITWDKPGVVSDGGVVTASGPREAGAFADAVLKLIDGK